MQPLLTWRPLTPFPEKLAIRRAACLRARQALALEETIAEIARLTPG
jgi:hypothetical protein